MKIMIMRSGGQKWQWDLDGGGTLIAATEIRMVDIKEPIDPTITIVYVLQTDLIVVGVDGEYELTCTYGSMVGEKIKGKFTDGNVTTLNLQPGDYEIVINRGSNHVVAGKFASTIGVG